MTERPEIGKIYVNGNTRVRVTDNDFQSFMFKNKFFIRVINLDNDCIQTYYLDDFNAMFKRDFTLSNLESGMVVECKNGKRYLVAGEYLCRNNGFNKLSDYNEYLISRYDSELGFDIVRVFKPRLRDAIDAIVSNNKLGELIWQREPEIKEVTLEEIAELLGVEVGSLRIKE